MRTRLRSRPITWRTPCRGAKTSTKLGPHRWVVKSSLARLAGSRRLIFHYERSARLCTVFFTLAATLTCYKRRRRETSSDTATALL
jgi:hypothetical protein